MILNKNNNNQGGINNKTCVILNKKTMHSYFTSDLLSKAMENAHKNIRFHNISGKCIQIMR